MIVKVPVVFYESFFESGRVYLFKTVNIDPNSSFVGGCKISKQALNE
jgi:hypothetical protein